MLTFFRKIRKSLIEPGSARKYVFYAIGEIALVVIGILIALQVNNWNEWGKERQREKIVLGEINESLHENLKTLEFALGRMKKGNASSEIVLGFLDGSVVYSDTLSHHFDRAQWPTSALIDGISDAGYTELNNAGIDILRNRALRKEVVKHFKKDMPQLFSWFTVKDNGSYANYDEHIRKNFIDLGGSHALPTDPEGIKNDNYYHSIIMTIYDTRKSLISRTNNFHDQSEKLLKLIGDELENFD